MLPGGSILRTGEHAWAHQSLVEEIVQAIPLSISRLDCNRKVHQPFSMDDGAVQKDSLTKARQDHPTWNRLMPHFGRAIAILSLGFFALKLFQNSQYLTRLQLNYSLVAASAAGVCLFGLSYVLLAQGWLIILRGSGFSMRFRTAYTILGASQIAKYMPGNVFQYVQRVSLGSKHGLSAEACVLSVGVETLLLMLTAVLFSLIGSLSRSMDLFFVCSIIPFKWYVGLSGIVLVGCLITILVLSPRFRGWVKARSMYLRPANIVVTSILYAAFFLVAGLVLLLLLKSMTGQHSEIHLFNLSWGFSLAWLLGFIVPGAPGGIGIREAVFVTLFGPRLGDGPAGACSSPSHRYQPQRSRHLRPRFLAGQKEKCQFCISLSFQAFVSVLNISSCNANGSIRNVSLQYSQMVANTHLGEPVFHRALCLIDWFAFSQVELASLKTSEASTAYCHAYRI